MARVMKYQLFTRDSSLKYYLLCIIPQSAGETICLFDCNIGHQIIEKTSLNHPFLPQNFGENELSTVLDSSSTLKLSKLRPCRGYSWIMKRVKFQKRHVQYLLVSSCTSDLQRDHVKHRMLMSTHNSLHTGALLHPLLFLSYEGEHLQIGLRFC